MLISTGIRLWSPRYFQRGGNRRAAALSRKKRAVDHPFLPPRPSPPSYTSPAAETRLCGQERVTPEGRWTQKAWSALNGFHTLLTAEGGRPPEQKWYQHCFEVKQQVLGPLSWCLGASPSSASLPHRDEAAEGESVGLLRRGIKELPVGKRLRVILPVLDAKCIPESSPPPSMARADDCGPSMMLQKEVEVPVSSVGDGGAESSLSFTRSELLPVFALFVISSSDDALLFEELKHQLKKALDHEREATVVSGKALLAGNKEQKRRAGSVAQLLYLLSEVMQMDSMWNGKTDTQLLHTFFMDDSAPFKTLSEPSSDGKRKGVKKMSRNTKEESVHTNSSLCSRELATYSFTEIGLLSVALGRFGLQDHPVFRRVVQEIRHHQWSRDTPLGQFAFHVAQMRKVMQKSSPRHHHAPPPPGSPGYTAHVADKAVELLLALELPSELRLNLSLLPVLQECLESLLCSSFFHPGAAQCVADVLAVNAVRHIARLASSVPPPPEEEVSAWPAVPLISLDHTDAAQAVDRLTHIVWRAVRRTEEQAFPQPLLAAALQHAITVSGKGVLVEDPAQGEADVSRLAFYDHVTADLIKVNRVY